MNNKLSIEDVSFSIDGRTILHHLSFTVSQGEFLSVLGPSGCGKTTLLRILIGLLQPTSGKIHKDGIDITKLHPSKRGMGIVFQNYALFENMTIYENIAYALRLQKNSDSINEQVRELLQLMKLTDHAQRKPAHLSGGQQQRVAIARTLALRPEILLFDEPMSALDVDTRLILRKELKDIQKRFGSTMIYITHDQEEAFAMSDRIMVMKDGVVHQIADPKTLMSQPADSYIEQFVCENLRIKMESLLNSTGSAYEK